MAAINPMVAVKFTSNRAVERSILVWSLEVTPRAYPFFSCGLAERALPQESSADVVG